MKNLRKVLAVVLVICMAFSLMAVASAKTTFSDQASVNYTEAVDLVSGLNIMVGDGGTGFNPAGTFTREQAAKVIVYMLLGGTIADSLKTSTSSFKDVAATRWSAPYIEYAASLGIIVGTGDGTFAPTAPVTGSAFAKMVLMAMGYGAKGEFTGASWEINAIIKAQSLGVLDTGVNYSAAATREQVAKYVFNALTGSKAFTVTYNPVTGVYVSNVVAAGATPTAAEIQAATLGGITFGLVNAPATLYGQPAHVWKLGSVSGTAVTGVYSAATVLHTAYNLTAAADVKALMTANNAAYVVPADATVTPIYNGVPGTADTLTNVTITAPVKGSVVQLVDTNGDGDVDIISVTTKTVKILAANTPVVTTTTGAVTTVSMTDLGFSGVVSTNVMGYQGLVKGDVVLFYTDGTKYYIEKATSVTGTITARTTTTATINGTNYGVSNITGAAALNGDVLSGTALFGVPNVTFYLDNGGYIVAAVSATATVSLNDYVFLRNAAPVTVGLTTKYAANAVFMDGTVAEITVAKTAENGGTLTATSGVDAFTLGATPTAVSADGKVAQYSYYTYTKNTDGTYNLTQVDVAKQALVDPTLYAAGSYATVKSADFLAAGGTALATGNTTYILQNAVGVFTKYTGVTAAPTYTIAMDATPDVASVYVLLNATSSTYADVAIGIGGTPGTTTAGADLVFVTGPKTEVYDAVAPYNTYPAIVNGVATTIKTDNLTLTVGTLYQVATYMGDKIATTAGSVTNATTDATVSALVYNAGTLTVDGTPYLTSSDVKVIVYNGGVTPATSSVTTADQIQYLTDIDGDDAVTVVADLAGTITAIYIKIA